MIFEEQEDGSTDDAMGGEETTAPDTGGDTGGDAAGDMGGGDTGGEETAE